MYRTELYLSKLNNLEYIELDELYLIVTECKYNVDVEPLLKVWLEKVLTFTSKSHLPLIEGEMIKEPCISFINKTIRDLGFNENYQFIV